MFTFSAGVVGAGTMGAEIAAVIAASGLPVVLCDIDAEAVQRGVGRAEALAARRLEQLTSSGRLAAAEAAAQLAQARALVSGSIGFGGLREVDLVIEAVPEDLELKLAVFAELDAATPGRAILASNTSSLSISELASVTQRPERVVGLHFFNPVSVMRLVEVVEGIETSTETLAVASSFVGSLRKTAVRCDDAPGFVVNRVLGAGLSELWRCQEQGGLAIAAVDAAIVAAKAAPMGPFALADMIGLDTALAVAEHLREAYGERFHVHQGLRELVARGQLGAKTGAGFYRAGEAEIGGSAETDAEELVERFRLRAFVEAALVLEEGIASATNIDVAVAAGAGVPALFAGADAAGLDDLLALLQRAAEQWGEEFEPPLVLRRLVAEGRLGVASGQGFFPTPRPDAGAQAPVRLETRGPVAIAWLDNPPANSISPAVIVALREIWDAIVDGGTVRALVIASPNPSIFCAGADIRAMAGMSEDEGRHFVEAMQGLLLEFGRSRIVTIAAVGGIALGGGCELAMAADIRIAAQSASFAQPEIKLGIMPGFGGTQRLPRLVGSGKALEMNLTGESIDALDAWEHGLVHRVVADHELLDTALAWARGLAAAAPLAIEQIKRVANGPELESGLELEKAGFARVLVSADAAEGTAAFLERRPARFRGH